MFLIEDCGYIEVGEIFVKEIDEPGNNTLSGCLRTDKDSKSVQGDFGTLDAEKALNL